MRITVQADKARYTMRGGIGASWHAIEHGERKGAGSAWGGNPAPDDAAGWQQLYRHADWLGLNWIRAEIEQRSYEAQRGVFTWDSLDMQALYRILDYCQSRDVDVMLQQMWGNVEWNKYPDVDALHSAPHDVAVYAESLAKLVEHLVRTRGYTCVKWLCINNEPGFHFSWWQGYGKQPLSITPGLKATRAALDARGLNVPIVGPDYTGMGWATKDIDFDDYIGAYDLHTYLEHFRLMPPGQSEGEKVMAEWVKYANARGKPFFLTEYGAMQFGWLGNHPGPGTYLASLKNLEIILRGLSAGVEAFNRWSFVNRGDLDGQWQLVDTWDTANDRLLQTFVPHANAYYFFGAIARFLRKYSTVLTTHVDGVFDGWQQYVLSEAWRDADGHVTVVVLNTTEQDEPIELVLEGHDGRPLFKYQLTEAIRNRRDARLDPAPVNGAINEIVPGFSVSVYSTRRIGHEELANHQRS